MVGINTLSKESIRVRSKNKGKRKKNKKVDSRKSVEESSYEHIGLSSNNSNEFFLSESSDTLNDYLIGLSQKRLTYPKNLIIGHLNINSVRNKFLTDCFKQTSFFFSRLFEVNLIYFCYLKLKLTIHFLILNSSQKASKWTVKIEPKPEEDFNST